MVEHVCRRYCIVSDIGVILNLFANKSMDRELDMVGIRGHEPLVRCLRVHKRFLWQRYVNIGVTKSRHK